MLHVCTHVILDVGFGVSLQQQRNQAMTFSLTDVMKSRVPLLHTKHLFTVRKWPEIFKLNRVKLLFTHVVDSVDADVSAQHGLHQSHVLPLFLQLQHRNTGEQIRLCFTCMMSH